MTDPDFAKLRALLDELAEKLAAASKQLDGLADCVKRMAEEFQQ